MTCKLESCNEPLAKGKRKFCCEDHSNAHYQEKKRLERLKKKQANAIERNCAYEECGKEIPKEAHFQKKYCIGTDCAYKQNQLDQKRQRAEAKKNKPVVIIKCYNDNCQKPIEKKHHRMKYCSDECRNAQNQSDHRDRLFIESSGYEESKRLALIHNGNKKELVIPSEFLGVRMSHKPKKEKRFEIKHFSAPWLQKLWDERETA